MAIMLRGPLVALLLVMLLPIFSPDAVLAQQGTALDASNSDVVLIIDHSGSMEENDPSFLRLAAAKLFIDLSDPGDKIGIVVMSGQRSTRVLSGGFGRVNNRANIDKLKGQVESLRYEPMGDETHMGSALSLAYDLLDSTPGGRYDAAANKHQFVVMLTDGLPTGAGQPELVDQTARRFQERGYWKVFSIALGAEADPDYLQRAVADPSGADVVVAQQASDLLDSYLEIYTRAGDDRFIDRVEVQPNTLAPLVTVQPDHQPTQISVVLLREDPNARISSLMAPDHADVVQPYYQNTVRRGSEPEYELYTIPLGAQAGLVGKWMVNVERQNFDPATVVVLSRSRMRMRLPVPAPLRREDDKSVRFHPVGQPLLLVAGAQVAKKPRITTGQPFVYEWVTGMKPVVQTMIPEESDPVTLTDDGRGYDVVAEDGLYTGLHPAFEKEGDYTVRLEMPRQLGESIHVAKEYVIRAVTLPTMTITLPPAATTLSINEPFSALIELPGRAEFQVDDIILPAAFIERPDGLLDPLHVEPTSDGRFRFEYTPAFSGSYRIGIAAEVQGRGPMGAIRYADYTEANVAVPESIPIVAVSAAFTETLTYDHKGVLNIPLTIESHSPEQEQLEVEVEGVAGTVAVPDQILVSANEVGQRTITVRMPVEDRPQNGQLTLSFNSPDQRVIVQSSKTTIPFDAPIGLLLPLLVILLLFISGGSWGYYRWQRQRRARTLLVSNSPRRLS